MFTTILLSLLLLACGVALKKAFIWRKEYIIARSTGFPVFVSPVHISDAWWMTLYPVLLPILERLPSNLTHGWLSISQLWKFWKMAYQPFEEVGCDTFILSTIKGNVLYSCDHSIIHDMLNQQHKVQIPIDLVGFYDIWGPTVGSVEGEEWKAHRKVISSGFSQSMNATVWQEAQRQTQTLIEHLMTVENSTMTIAREWTSKLALHVISCGFFNMRLDWATGEHTKSNSGQLPKTLPFDQAIVLLLRRLSTVFVTPRALLHKLPFTMFQEASLALKETERYIIKQRMDTEANIETMMKKRNLSFLEAIVVSGKDSDMTNRVPFLGKSVLANIFFMLMAGHDTVGSSLQFIFMFSALYPEIQHKIQAHLDEQLGDHPAGQWSLERDYPALLKGYIGAVQKEILTIYQPASFLLRRIVEPVTLIDSDGNTHHVPAGTLAIPNTSAAYKNPRLWKPAQVPEERKKALCNSPALYFNPDRWLDSTGLLKETIMKVSENKQVPDWWGFGQGPRACPGRAFAQIEMTSVMATLYRDYSLELVVDERTVSEYNGDQQLAWEKTRDNGIRMLYTDIEANISISMPTPLPIRVVERLRNNALQ